MHLMLLRRAVLLLGIFAPLLGAQSAFVSVMKSDTVQIERFTRTATRLDHEIITRGGPRQIFSSVIGPNGSSGAITLAV